MKKTVIAYWTIVVAAGIVAGVFAAHLEKYEAITGNLEKTKTLPFQRPATEAIECSKDMRKAALLTHFPDSNSSKYSLPRRPHN